MSSPPSPDAAAHSNVNLRNKERKGMYGQGGRTILNIYTGWIQRDEPSLVLQVPRRPMSDRVSSFSSPLFPELNALERMAVQEVDSASLGYAFMSSEFIDPITDALLVQQSTFPGLERMRVHEVDTRSGFTTRSRSKEMISVMGLGTWGWGQYCRHAPGSIRRGSLPIGRNTCPGGPPVYLPIFF